MIGLKDAVRGAPVAALWPAAASVMVYSDSPTVANTLILITMTFAGSMTYTTMRQVKGLFDEVKTRPTRRSRRGSGQQKSKLELMNEVHELTIGLMPDSRKVMLFIAFCILVDVAGLLAFLSIFIYQVFVIPDPGTAITGITLLPIAYLFVIISILIWNI